MRISSVVLVAVVCGLPSLVRADLNAGLFTEVQAQRGEETYRAHCVSCHGNDLRGNSNSPSLVGMSFLFLWEGRSLDELYSKMRTGMPTDNPGSLSAGAYADVLAFILSMNGYPAGLAELGTDADAIGQVTITAPP